MPASVPTAEEFTALADRVAALEGAAPGDPDPAPEPEPGPVTYVVQPGDTLSAIAAMFGVTVAELVAWNAVTDPGVISIGAVLVVVEPTPEPEPEPEPGAVPAPTGLTAVADQDRRVIVLNWEPVPGVQSYTIYEDTSEIGRAGFAGITDTTDVDRGPMGDDREYVWTVTAVRGGKESPRSNVAKATIGDDEPDPKPNPEPGPDPKPGGRGLVAAVPFDGSGDDPFEGFNRGDSGIRQWSDDGPNTFQLVEYQGQTYGRARITGGPHDRDIRAEGIVVALGTDSTLKLRPGDEYWFGDTIVIGEGFPARHFNNVLQWKGDGTGSAPMYFGAWDDGMQLRSSFGNRDVGDIDFGRPHRYVFGVLFDDDGDGWVEVWRDGEQTLARTPASTLLSGKQSYPKVGYYRGEEIVGTGSVYHRDYRIGRDRESVS